ncbi:MAG: 30S ribosomal protein S12 methylthiotransferase RimO [Clostridia bacterium]|nr:30S ribosomal protein S12 methylthiotransferase RimO [Clostridia bacterium]
MTIKELQQKKVCVISLGCDKNRVDAERMLYKLKEFGMTILSNPQLADIVIVNTCAFIQSARQESIDEILSLVDYKKQNLQKLIVVGCLPAKANVDVLQMIPEVDATLNTRCEDELIPLIAKLYACKLDEPTTTIAPCQRIMSTMPHTAFLKIADGCNNKCSYCTIPQIRGAYVSTPIEVLVNEAEALVAGGVRELILVAQDVTRYGEDLYKKHRLVDLIQELSKIQDLKWIRLHYCYPEFVRDDLINEIATNPKVCKYMDIPIQHIDNDILKNMNRASTYERVTTLITKLRNACPDITIRTSIIVGFPGEDNTKFNNLVKFLEEYKLDNVGFFPYSREENTVAYDLDNQVPERVKTTRLQKLVKLQTKIMQDKQANRIGTSMLAVCEEIQDTHYVFRSQYDSPEIDSVIVVLRDNSTPLVGLGEFCNIKIIGLIQPFDLQGEII